MCLLLDNINKGYFNYDDDIEIKEQLKIFINNTKNDDFCKIYASFPA